MTDIQCLPPEITPSLTWLDLFVFFELGAACAGFCLGCVESGLLGMAKTGRVRNLHGLLCAVAALLWPVVLCFLLFCREDTWRRLRKDNRGETPLPSWLAPFCLQTPSSSPALATQRSNGPSLSSLQPQSQAQSQSVTQLLPPSYNRFDTLADLPRSATLRGEDGCVSVFVDFLVQCPFFAPILEESKEKGEQSKDKKEPLEIKMKETVNVKTLREYRNLLYSGNIPHFDPQCWIPLYRFCDMISWSNGRELISRAVDQFISHSLVSAVALLPELWKEPVVFQDIIDKIFANVRESIRHNFLAIPEELLACYDTLRPGESVRESRVIRAKCCQHSLRAGSLPPGVVAHLREPSAQAFCFNESLRLGRAVEVPEGDTKYCCAHREEADVHFAAEIREYNRGRRPYVELTHAVEALPGEIQCKLLSKVVNRTWKL